MKEVRIDFEKFDGDLDSLIVNSSNNDKYLLRMVDINDDSDYVRMELCVVHEIMNGKIGIIGGHFHTDWRHMRVTGVCKILCD